MSRLLDYAHKQAEGLPLRLDNIENMPVTIQAVRFNDGQFGAYAVMTVVKPDGEIVDVMTSAMLVLDALVAVVDAGALPAEVTFNKNGRTWIIE